MWLGLPVLWAVPARAQRVSFAIARRDWPELARLALNNMIIWHVLAILAVQALSSGRAAILGYTMPIFSAIYGVAVLGERLRPRHVAGIVAAAVGVSLLLWHEFGDDRRQAVRGDRHARRRRRLGGRHAADAAHHDRRADARDRLLDDAARRRS